MDKKFISLLLAIALILCMVSVSALSALAEDAEELCDGVADHVLQFGGLLPEAPLRLRGLRSAPNEALKQVIYDGLSARSEEINISEYNVTEDDLSSIYRSVLNENPELFFVKSGYLYYHSSSVVTRILPKYDDTYTDDDVADYQDAMRRITGMVDPEWSDIERLLFLHDYLVTHCEYDTTYERHNAHDALVIGSAVCQGYTLAYYDLCRNSGISASVITSTDINHAWNLVTADGDNYYVDCTWDDPVGDLYEAFCRHSNFMLSRDALSENHNSTDWTNGTVNVYTVMETSDLYDDAWWQGATTAVPLIGHVGAYSLSDNRMNIYLRDFSDDSVTEIPLASESIWRVWENNTAYWPKNYSTVAALNGAFYFTLPDEIWSLSLDGEINPVYALTEEQRSQGYIYGMVNDRGTLYYSIGIKDRDTPFARFALQFGTVTGECDGFVYQVLDDGTASIIGCERTGEVAIPDTLDGYTVSNLAAQLFFGNDSITAVSIPATVTSFGEDASDNNWDYVFSYCYDLARIDVAEDNPCFSSVDGVLYNKDKTTLINYPCNRPGEVYHAEADLFCCTSFASCRNLKFLFIDNPDNWWYTYTFNNTPALTAFYIPGGNTEDKVAAERQAGRVQDGTEQNPWCALASTDEIHSLPGALTVIQQDAFQGTNIQYLVAPDACELIETGAFADSALAYLRVGPDTVIEEGAVGEEVVIDMR